METFALPPCDPDLPRVACLYQITPTLGRVNIYGSIIPLPLGTVIHPNEHFDGAVVGWMGGSPTYGEQNHEVFQGLVRKHGKQINLVGCVLFGDLSPLRVQKERVSSAASKMAGLLGAQTAIIIGSNGSQLAIDLMLTVRKCEEAGIKTTLIYPDIGSGVDDPGFIFSLPEADAIVCTGSREQRISLPPMEALIGGNAIIATGLDTTGSMSIPIGNLPGVVSMQGSGRLTTRFE
jgi:glycine reductase